MQYVASIRYSGYQMNLITPCTIKIKMQLRVVNCIEVAECCLLYVYSLIKIYVGLYSTL